MTQREGVHVAAGGDPEYGRLLRAVERSRATIERLEGEPPSPKRESALELIRHRHGQALQRLSELESHSHRI